MTMIKDEIVTYDVAKLAREKGFNEIVRHFYEEGTKFPQSMVDRWNEYSNAYSAPTQSLLQRWLREKKGIEVYAKYTRTHQHWTYIAQTLTEGCYKGHGGYKSYELALEDGLKYALKYLV